MSGQPGLWESHERGESSTAQFKSERAKRSLWDYPSSSAAGAVDYGSGSATNCNLCTVAHSHTSDNAGSTMNCAAPSPVSDDVKGKGKATAVDPYMPLLNSGGLPPLLTAMEPYFASEKHHVEQFSVSGYGAGLNQSVGRGGTHALPATSGLMNPFTPGHQSSGHQSSGHQSSGHQSSGHQSSGHQSSGHQSSGHQSSGHQSSGHQSSGHQSSGHQSSGHQSSGHQSSAEPGGWPHRELPSFFGPQNPGHDGPGCRCAVCSSSPQAMCFQQQLAQQHASINEVWADERTRLEATRSRVESLVRQEGRIILDHYRQGWDEERNRLQHEINALRKAIKGLEDGHLKICDDHRKLWAENLKLQEDNSRLQEDNSRLREDNSTLKDALSKPRDVPGQAQGGVEGVASHHGNARPIFTNPFASAASGQGDRPRAYNGGNGGQGVGGSWTAWSDPTSLSTSFAGHVKSSWPVQAPTRATSRSPPPAGVSASQGPALSDMPSDEYVPMSPQPVYWRKIASPSLSFCRSSPAPFVPDSPPSFSPEPIPTRSPKRPLPVIDVNEVDAGLEGISLKADTVRKTTFAEVDSEGAPPSKRQRSLSRDYFIIGKDATDFEEEEEDYEEEEEDTERDPEEVRRLKMHAGHTPPTSPPLRHGIAKRVSRGSPTPVAPSSPPQREPAYIAELERAEASGSLSSSSGDVPLAGPLMMQNDPAEDESFLSALHEKLKPISQGLDAIPSAARSPSVESDKIPIYLEESLEKEREPGVKVENPSFPIKTKEVNLYDCDDDSDDAKGAESEVAIKFKSTSNFGAPFGRM